MEFQDSFEQFRRSDIYNSVRRFRNLFFALAAFLWLPVSAHCQLEALTGVNFLACETDSICHNGSQSGSDNADCCSVENSQYHAAPIRGQQPLPHWLPVVSKALIQPAASALIAENDAGILTLTAGPFELLPSRHFLLRTALPVRAPSLAS